MDQNGVSVCHSFLDPLSGLVFTVFTAEFWEYLGAKA